MLALMRKALKKGLLQFVVWFTFIAMVLTYSMGDILKLIQRVFGLHDYVVSIGSNGITREEFLQKENSVKQKIELIKKQYGPYAAMVMQMYGLDSDPKTIALNESVQKLLFDQITNKYKINVDENLVKQEFIRQLPKELVDEQGNFDEQALAKLLNGVSINEIEKNIEDSLKINTAQNLIDSSIFIPKFIVDAKYNEAFALKRFSILSFQLSKYFEEAKKSKASEQELKSYYLSNKDNYMVPEKRTATVWKFPLKNFGVAVDQKEVEAFYNKNKNNYIETPAQIEVGRILLKFEGKNPSELRQKAFEIKTELTQDPSKFSELAKKHSDDKDSAVKGGSIGFVEKGKLDPVLEEAVFAFEKDGQISDILRTEEGLEIVQRVSRKAPKFKPLSKVEAEIKKALESKRFNASFNAEAKKVIREAKKNIMAIQDFMKNKKGDEQTIVFSKGDGSLITPKIFNLALKGFGFTVQDETAYIFRLENIEKSYLPKFDTVLGEVESSFYKEKAKELMAKDIEKARLSGKPFKDLGQQYSATLTVTPLINTESSSELEKYKKQNIPVAELLDMSRAGSFKILYNKEGNGFLAKVDESQAPSFDFAKKKALEKDLYIETKNDTERGFIASLAKNAKIKVNINEIRKKAKHSNER